MKELLPTRGASIHPKAGKMRLLLPLPSPGFSVMLLQVCLPLFILLISESPWPVCPTKNLAPVLVNFHWLLDSQAICPPFSPADQSKDKGSRASSLTSLSRLTKQVSQPGVSSSTLSPGRVLLPVSELCPARAKSG